jgi:hypothetical protein
LNFDLISEEVYTTAFRNLEEIKKAESNLEMIINSWINSAK